MAADAAPDPGALGLAHAVSPREWAATVLLVETDLSLRATGRLVGLDPDRIAECATQAARYTSRLRDADPPPQVWWPAAADAATLARPLLARRRARRIRVLVACSIAVALVAGVGVVVQRSQPLRAQAEGVELPVSAATADGRHEALVETSAGRLERLTIDVAGPRVSLQVAERREPATADRVTVHGRYRDDAAVQGTVRGMPVYVVHGRVDRAKVTFGPTVADRGDRAVRVLRAGAWSVLWPAQTSLARTTREPVGVLWHRPGGATGAATVRGSYPATHRMTVRLAGRSGLLMSDGTSLMVQTWHGQAETPILGGRAVLPAPGGGSPLPYAGVGYGSATAATARDARIELIRDPAGSPLFVLRPRALSPPESRPERIAVTVRDGTRVVDTVTLRPGPT